MAQIQPIPFPFIGDAVTLKVMVNQFETTASTTSLSWYLLTVDGHVCLNGVYNMTNDEYDLWGQDNTYLDDLVAGSIPVVIVYP